MKLIAKGIVIVTIGAGLVLLWEGQTVTAEREIISSTPYVRSMYSLPATFDPSQMNEGAALIFAETAYEGLVRFNESFGVQPGIAYEWGTSNDGKTLTFTLNPKAKFHDGSNVTSHDVVASLKRNLAPKSLVVKYYDHIKGAKEFYEGKTGDLKGVRAVNDYTVEIELERPFPPFLYILAGSTAKILPEKIIKANDFSVPPIGAGPFQVESFDKDRIVFKAFDDYHGAKPKIKEIIFQATDQKEAIRLARNGKIHDLSVWPLDGTEEIFKVGQKKESHNLETWIIGFNTRIKPLDSLNVRRSLKASFNSESFRKKFYPDALSAFGYIPPGIPGHQGSFTKEKQPLSTSPEQIIIAIPKELSRSDEMASYIENTLTKKGWSIKAKPMGWTDMMRLYNEKKLQAFLFSMNMEYPDVELLLNHFDSKNPDNFSGIKDEGIDQLLHTARSTPDRFRRYGILHEVTRRVNNLAVTINLFHPKSYYWVNKCVRGFKPNLIGSAYIDYRKVFLDQNCLEKESAL